MANYKGDCYCTTSNLTGAYHFRLATQFLAPAQGRTDRTGWELDAGASITLHFSHGSTGTLPPIAPDGDGGDLVSLDVYYETGTGTLVRNLFSGTSPPASGTTYTFYATHNGLAGGSPRKGTLRLRIRAIQTGELLDNYNIDSDTQDAGVLRCNDVVNDSELNHDGYPSGSTYAIGVAGTESVGITFDHAPPFAERGHEDVRIDILDGATVQASGAQQDVTGATTTQSFAVNAANFDDTSKTYGIRATPIGNAQLQPTSEGSMLWSRLIAGTGTTLNGTAVEHANDFTVDPRVTIQNTTLSKSLHNLGDSTTIDFNVQNARSENLTRSITVTLKDSGGGTVQSGSDSGANYDIDRTLLATDDADFNFTGAQYTFEASQAEFTAVSANAYAVSRKVMIGSSVGSNDLAINTDEEVYNRGETVTYDFFVSAADGTAYTRTVDVEVHNTAHAVENQRSEANGDGHFQDTYVIASGDTATGDQTGSLKHIEIDPTGTDGNSADVSAAEWGVSTLRVIHSSATLPSGDPANADNAVTNTITTTSDDGGAGDRTLLNVLETVDVDYYVFGVRGQPWPFSLNSRIIAADNSTDFTDVQSPDGAGLVSYTRTIANGVESLNDFVGDAKHIRIDSSDANDTVNAADSFNVSNRIMIGSAVGLDDGSLVIEVGTVGSGDDGTLSGVYPTAIFNRDAGESDVAISTFLSYARGTKYANQSISGAVHSDVHGVEDSQAESTDTNGLLTYVYTIANADKAGLKVDKTTGGYSALPVGSPKHLVITDGDNVSADSSEDWGVTEHVWLDVHDEREEPLDKDAWNPADPTDGSENANEEQFQYVILGDTLNVWAHAMSVRLDREIETWDGDTGTYPANRAVRLRTISPGGSTNAELLTDTAADGWTSGVDDDEDGELDTGMPGMGDPNHAQFIDKPWVQQTGSMTPASSNWQVQAELDFDGLKGKANDLITIASPLITSKVRIFAPATVAPAETFKVYVEVLDKEIASGEIFATFQPAEPESPPTIAGLTIDIGSPDAVNDDVVARIADKNGTGMLNVVDDTETVNGALYYLEVTAPVLPGEVISWFGVASLGGDAFATAQTRVVEPDFNPLGEIFA